jgi:hypothetical protein
LHASPSKKLCNGVHGLSYFRVAKVGVIPINYSGLEARRDPHFTIKHVYFCPSQTFFIVSNLCPFLLQLVYCEEGKLKFLSRWSSSKAGILVNSGWNMSLLIANQNAKRVGGTPVFDSQMYITPYLDPELWTRAKY